MSPEYPASDSSCLSPQDRALVRIGRALQHARYSFTTTTPLTHRRVLRRSNAAATSYRDIFGWSRTFRAQDLSEDVLSALREAGALQAADGGFRSTVRYSTLAGQLFAHSAFPTEQPDAVFFGPDTCRFARAITLALRDTIGKTGMRVLDVGAGSGAGGLHAAALLSSSRPRIVLTDINQSALRFSRINASINETPDVSIACSDLYAAVDGVFDLIIANPPYLVDPLARLYRHGGGELGFDLSLRIVREGIAHLAPTGRLLLYTGSAIVDGVDLFECALREALAGQDVKLAYEEIDPDVFGEELEAPPYDRADRIAVVAATIARQGS